MKLNRKWLLVIALVLSLTMATAGTLAYLTDRDSEANVFTFGNVEIDLNEDFENGAQLIPGVDIEKKPTITNTGKNDAWVWATIAIPAALDNEDASKNVIHFNYDDDYVNAQQWTWKGEDGQWLVETNVDHEGVLYNVYTVLYQTALKPGDITPAVMTKVYMDPHVDIDPEGNLSHVEKGEVTPLAWNINTDGNPIIYVSAYAMQTDGFKSVEEAYAAYTAQWTTTDGLNNGIEWGTPKDPSAPAVGDDDNVTYTVPEGAVVVESTDDLLTALSNGKTDILLKDGEYEWTGNAGHGKTLNLYGESKDVVLYITNEAPGGEAADYSFQNSKVTFNGLTISSTKYVPNGNNYPGFAYMEATYNDCVIDQTYVLYKGPQIFNYCTLNVSGDQYNIWTWGGEDITFNYCTFNSDGKAILLYNGPTTVLTINNCLFNDNGGLSDLKAAIEIGQDYGNRKYTLYVNNTVVNGYEINNNGISTGTTLWGNKNSMTTEDLNVVVDGVDVY